MRQPALAEIPLGHGPYRAVLDLEDWLVLREHKWCRMSAYVGRNIYWRDDEGRKCSRSILMHRVILGLLPDDERRSDHINRNPLDNRRCNLRICTQAENVQNKDSYQGSSSRFRGVSRHRGGKWQAYIKVDGRQHYLSLYDDEEEAGRVAAEARRESMPYSQEAA